MTSAAQIKRSGSSQQVNFHTAGKDFELDPHSCTTTRFHDFYSGLAFLAASRAKTFLKLSAIFKINRSILYIILNSNTVTICSPKNAWNISPFLSYRAISPT